MTVNVSSTVGTSFTGLLTSLSAKDAPRPAFQETLRGLEQAMWPGARAGLAPTAMRSSVSLHRMSPFVPPWADSVEHAKVMDLQPSRQIIARSTANLSSRVADATRGVVWLHAYDATERSPVMPATPRVSVDLAAPAATMSQPVPPRTTGLDDAFPQEAQEPSAPGDSHHARSRRQEALSDSAPPLRITLLQGAAGIFLVMRCSSALADTVADLRQVAQQELRRLGIQDARIVINGISQTPLTTQGIRHGD